MKKYIFPRPNDYAADFGRPKTHFRQVAEERNLEEVAIKQNTTKKITQNPPVDSPALEKEKPLSKLRGLLEYLSGKRRKTRENALPTIRNGIYSRVSEGHHRLGKMVSSPLPLI